jgi:hypothetical protein
MGIKSGSGSGIFWVKKLKFFDANRGSGMEKIRIWDKHPASATLISRVPDLVDPWYLIAVLGPEF